LLGEKNRFGLGKRENGFVLRQRLMPSALGTVTDI